MTVRELILLLEKHGPEMSIVLMRPDYDFVVYTDLKGVVENLGVKEDDRHWSIDVDSEEPDAIKVLLMD